MSFQHCTLNVMTNPPPFITRLAVDYMFMVNDGADVRSDLLVEPFNAVNEQNDYEVKYK